MRFWPLGDSAVTAVLSGEDAGARVAALAEAVRRHAPVGLVDVVPAFDSVTVFYDPIRVVEPYQAACDWIRTAHANLPAQLLKTQEDVAEIPVVYGGDHGPELQSLARAAQLGVEELIQLHSSADYTVLAIGFMPGFAYLGGLPDKLKAPRLKTPRTLVPAGSVGIGGEYSGIYPFASPGGWNLIGRTSLKLFDPAADSPALLRVGQTVRFVQVDSMEIK